MATPKQRAAIEKVVENRGKSVSSAMREAGYSDVSAKNPRNLTDSKAWSELMETYLPDEALAKVHESLLRAHMLDHMVFPLVLTDDEIKGLLESTGCVVRRLQHSETQTHCWFWSPNTKAQKDAIELAYKLKGRLKDSAKVTDSSGRTLMLINMEPEANGGSSSTRV